MAFIVGAWKERREIETKSVNEIGAWLTSEFFNRNTHKMTDAAAAESFG